ncbi:MAG: hypothetical protein KFF73_07060 [Cyclobacteriaceae bacterium]|nr:hypothetical protein [Cyclobacteriaceae bacterium]
MFRGQTNLHGQTRHHRQTSPRGQTRHRGQTTKVLTLILGDLRSFYRQHLDQPDIIIDGSRFMPCRKMDSFKTINDDYRIKN